MEANPCWGKPDDMTARHAPSILVLGIGNSCRGDDAVGLLVAGRLMEHPAPDGVTIRRQEGEGTALLEALDGPRAAILIDAVESGAVPGTIHRWDVSSEGLKAKVLRCSTHNFSVHDAVETARALGKLPPRVMVFGIEGKCFQPGSSLSPQVEAVLEALAEQVWEAIHTLQRETRQE